MHAAINTMKWMIPVLFAACCAVACAQTLPENPAPAPSPDPMWARVQNLKINTPVVVSDTYGPPVRCLFAEATEAYLDCNPVGNPPGTGFRFNRADVISVELDRPGQNALQAAPKVHNYHPVWISSIIAGGLISGLVASQSNNTGDSVRIGAIGALVVGAIGAPMTFFPRDQFASSARPGFAVGIPFRLRLGLR